MRRTGLRVAGIVVLVAGVVAGALLWLAAGSRYDDAVGDLAPVPVGCTTTLEFERAGTYTFFLESKGRVGEIDGDCQTEERTYDVAEDDVPRVSLSLLDERGDDIDLDRVEGPSYDRGGQRGVGFRRVDIEEPGDYELTATATTADTDVLVRVGRDPAGGVTALRIAAGAALLLGLVVGVLLILAAARRRPAAVPVWPTGPQWPAGPMRQPVAPPPVDPPVTPPYTPRPPSYGPYQPSPPPPAWQPPPRPPGGYPGRGEPLPPPRPE